MYPLSTNFNFTASTLEEFVEYNISVRAYSSAGSGPFSDIAMQTTNAAGLYIVLSYLANCHFLPFILFIIVPAQSPQNVIVTNISATQLTVCFYPPSDINQNGLITSFNITYQGIELDTSIRTIEYIVAQTMYPLTGRICVNLTNLQEFINYNTSVVAINTVGTGPASIDVMQITDESSK